MPQARALAVCIATAAWLAGCAASPPADAGGRSAVLACDGRRIHVTFSDGAAVMALGGKPARLQQQPTGSGIHYTGDGQDLRGKGANVTWTDASGVAHACVDEALAAEAPARSSTPALAGTHWKLLHFQPGAAGAPAVVPPNVERYTLHFAADGALAMGLDCNRGTARWTAQPTAANSGALTISPGAMTRAMCLSGAIDTQLAADLSNVRSYAIDAGRLSLTLEDGGVYLWAPGAADQD